MKPIRGITGSVVIDEVTAISNQPAPSRPINRYTRFGQAMRRELAAHIPGQTADEREAMIKAATTPR